MHIRTGALLALGTLVVLGAQSHLAAEEATSGQWPTPQTTITPQYRGVMTDDCGVPLDGVGYTFSLEFSQSGVTLCQQSTDDVPVTGGRFSIAIEPKCAQALAAYPNLTVAVEVETADGTVIGLPTTSSGPVPFAANGVPVGTMLPFAGAGDVPAGYLECDGSTRSRAEFPALFAAIGCTWSGPECNDPGAVSFTIPDMRGRFPRGWSADMDGAVADTARAMGTYQSEALGSHKHTYSDWGTYKGNVAPDSQEGFPEGADGKPACGGYTVDSPGNTTIYMCKRTVPSSTTGTETRPHNATARYIIRY